MHQSEFLGYVLGLGGFSRAWGSEEDHSWRSAGSCASEPYSQHLGQVVSYHVHLGAGGAVVLVDESFESILDTLNMEVILLNSLVDNFIKLIPKVTRAVISHGLLDGFLRSLVIALQKDELIRNNSDLLQAHSLDFSSWETFHNPAFVFFLMLEHSCLHQVDNDLVWHVSVVFLAFSDSFAEFALFSDFFL